MDRQVAEAIDREIAFSTAKWPAKKTLGDFLMVLEAEVQEAKQDYIKGRRPECLMELLQSAAVAVNAIEHHGFMERLEVSGDVAAAGAEA